MLVVQWADKISMTSQHVVGLYTGFKFHGGLLIEVKILQKVDLILQLIKSIKLRRDRVIIQPPMQTHPDRLHSPQSSCILINNNTKCNL